MTRELWYLTRGAGAVTLVLLTATVVLGITESMRWSAAPRWPRFAFHLLHRNVSLLALVFVVIHVLTAVIDSFAPLRLVDALVPFVSRYRPLWVGFGALAFDMLLAVLITSGLRRHIGFRTWRTVHWLAYACWPVALVHGLGTGTDANVGWMLVLSGACVAAVLAALTWRVLSGWTEPSPARNVTLGTMAIAPLLLVGWIASGPLASNWARRSGTPANLLAGGATRTAAAVAPALKPPFTADLSGSLSQGNAAGGLAVVQIDATMSGGADGHLRATLTGVPEGNGVAMQSSRVTLGPSSNPSLYTGRITSLSGASFVASLSSASGHALTLTVNMEIDPGTGSLTGTAQATTTAPTQ